uniref:Uncharacterized protein n=1 Tax=Toxoplasma gondii COUG TaxID=1074873 RepID=A0A2G8Y830_TOXGO|nr:hypothetical protein TGCOUG_229750B [Toxoplasma gondii COUG]
MDVLLVEEKRRDSIRNRVNSEFLRSVQSKRHLEKTKPGKREGQNEWRRSRELTFSASSLFCLPAASSLGSLSFSRVQWLGRRRRTLLARRLRSLHRARREASRTSRRPRCFLSYSYSATTRTSRSLCCMPPSRPRPCPTPQSPISNISFLGTLQTSARCPATLIRRERHKNAPKQKRSAKEIHGPLQGWLFNWVASMACLPPPPSCCASAQVNIKEFVSAIRRRVYARAWALQLLHHYCRHPERPPPLQALHSLLLLLPSPGAALGSCVLFTPVSALEVPAFSAGPAEVASLFGDEDKGDRDSASPRLFCGPASNSEAPAAGRKKGEDDVEKDIWKRMREAFLEDEDALAFKAIFEAHGRRVYALIKVFLNDRPANFRLFENVAPAPTSPPDAREGDEGQNAKEDLEEETPKEERSAEVDEGPSRLSLEALEEMVNVTVVDRFSAYPAKLALGLLAAQIEHLKCGVDRYAGGEALERSEMERPSEKVKKTALLAEKRLGVENGEEEGLSAATEDDSVPE